MNFSFIKVSRNGRGGTVCQSPPRHSTPGRAQTKLNLNEIRKQKNLNPIVVRIQTRGLMMLAAS